MKKTLGGDRLGSGSKQKVDLRGYERSTHDLGYIFKSTMAAGTLVPFMSEVALPGDTFDITLDCDIKTHPTIGPLFGSYKVQLDVFEAPIRLYQGKLHNNALGIGNKMSEIKLPYITLAAQPAPDPFVTQDNKQINPSCILAYLGIRGVGFNHNGPGATEKTRDFNAVPLLAYWEIYKQYYANKQEQIGAYLHTEIGTLITTVTTINVTTDFGASLIPVAGAGDALTYGVQQITVNYTGTVPNLKQIYINTSIGRLSIDQLKLSVTNTGTALEVVYNRAKYGGDTIFHNWSYRQTSDISITQPEIRTFQLSQIDDMRNALLAAATSSSPVSINALNLEPTSTIIFWNSDGYANALGSQEGLGIKTYQSDIFNNWLETDWIDGAGGITEVTAIDTSGGSFTIDTLNLSRKVYDMLNRIAVSGGSYDDWIDAVYTENKYTRCESPIYHGGLIKELVFQEVVSNSASSQEGGQQPLGTLAGKGIMAHKHKGGSITIKVSEPGYIIGIVSLTPRIDYSQGNKWDVHLKTMDDFHKPALDEIGFQELITEQMAYWATYYDAVTGWTTTSAGKQPAWINYMTNHNRTYGNFAIPKNEMFMTLNRRYEWDDAAGPGGTSAIKDLTTYIDPAKFNQIFAQTSLDSQNFWTQIAVNLTTRRLMSARIMPNL